MKHEPDYRRIFLGISAVVSLVLGVWLALQSSTDSSRWSGTWIRTGALFGVIWLAYPQLKSLPDRLPALLTGALTIGIFLVAIRPAIGRIIIGLAGAGLALYFGWKWIKNTATSS